MNAGRLRSAFARKARGKQPHCWTKERGLNEIQSTAYRQVQQIRGKADGKATEIYTHAYTQNVQAGEFYNFLKSMDTYRKVLTRDSTLIFSTDSDLFGLLRRARAEPQT